MTMTIADMQSHREALEARLRNVAAEIVDEFQRRTNLGVSAVYIDLVHEHQIGNKQTTAIVTAARISVEL